MPWTWACGRASPTPSPSFRPTTNCAAWCSRARAARPPPAGADIEEFKRSRGGAKQAGEYAQVTHHAMQAIATSKHPTLAVIEGACVGGGLEIASVCDMRICGTVEPLRRAGQQAGPGDVVRRTGRPGRPGRPRHRVGNRARRPRVRRQGSFREAPGQPRGRRRRRAVAGRRHRAPHRQRRTAGGALAQKFVRRLAEPRPLTKEEADEA